MSNPLEMKLGGPFTISRGVAGAGATLFIGDASVLANSYSSGNKTFTANGGSSLPACLFICGFVSSDSVTPTVFTIGSTSLTKVSSESANTVQLWAAVYAGGSDTITIGNGSQHNTMAIAAGWSTDSSLGYATSPQSGTYGSANANSAVHFLLSSACVVPTSGLGFVVGSCAHSSFSANNKNWASVESSPTPNDGYTAGRARISLACKSAAGSWSPEFWGSTNADVSAYNFAAGLAACAFNPYETESLAVFNAFSTPPTYTRRAAINTCVAALKAAGVWTKLDVLYMFAAADSQAALINWKNPGTFNATANGSPTFTADHGFTGTTDSTTKYIDTGFNASTASGQYTQNSAHMSCWSLTSAGMGNAAVGLWESGGSGYQTTIYPRNTGGDDTAYFRINMTGFSGASTANDNGAKFALINRSGASSQESYLNGVAGGTDGSSSTSLDNRNFYTLGINDGGTAKGWGGDLAATSFGGSLNSTEVAAFYRALETYLGTVGAIHEMYGVPIPVTKAT